MRLSKLCRRRQSRRGTGLPDLTVTRRGVGIAQVPGRSHYDQDEICPPVVDYVAEIQIKIPADTRGQDVLS
jgi:hypothetical protein